MVCLLFEVVDGFALLPLFQAFPFFQFPVASFSHGLYKQNLQKKAKRGCGCADVSLGLDMLGHCEFQSESKGRRMKSPPRQLVQ